MSNLTQRKTSKQNIDKYNPHSFRNTGNKPFNFTKVRQSYVSLIANKKKQDEMQPPLQNLNMIINPQFNNSSPKKQGFLMSDRFTVDKWKQKYYSQQTYKLAHIKSINHFPIIHKNKQIDKVLKFDQVLTAHKKQSYRRLNEAMRAKKAIQFHPNDRVNHLRLSIGNFKNPYMTQNNLKKIKIMRRGHQPRNSLDVLGRVIQETPQGWQFYFDGQQSYIAN